MSEEKIRLKTPQDIAVMRQGGQILVSILEELTKTVRPGVTTGELNGLAEKLIKEAGAQPAFKGYGQPPFPAALCTSINSCVVHGVPGDYRLKDGDIVGLDCGILYQGRFTDAAVSVGVGQISSQAVKLLKVANQALIESLAVVKSGATIGDIGAATQRYVENLGFNVVRELSGHGVGFNVHEPPSIPNFGQVGKGLKLEPGMVLAIEPMITAGDWHLQTADNGWDACTVDNSLTAHFERTVVVTSDGYEDLTPWQVKT